ncbi:hypothetical protein E4U54_006598, partial [Claviceps lovelessii]
MESRTRLSKYQQDPGVARSENCAMNHQQTWAQKSAAERRRSGQNINTSMLQMDYFTPSKDRNVQGMHDTLQLDPEEDVVPFVGRRQGQAEVTTGGRPSARVGWSFVASRMTELSIISPG